MKLLQVLLNLLMHTFFLSMYHTERPATLMKKEAPKQPFPAQNCEYLLSMYDIPLNALCIY